MPPVKLSLAILFIFAAAILGARYFTQPASYISGEVENQIHGFGQQMAPALAPNSTFTRTAVGYKPKPEPPQAPTGLKPVELQAWLVMAQRESGGQALVPTFPERYSAGTCVRAQGMGVSLKPLRSNAAVAQIENGKLVYHEAYTSTDSLNVVSGGRSEEFLLLHDAQAPQRFEYDISAVSGVKDISLQDNAVHFRNARGRQLQIEAPWLIETGGQKVANAVHWELSYPNGESQPRLALVITNAKQLHYPLVIDPTWVAPMSSLNTARYNHTATLLNNGMVLVAGGFNNNSGYLVSAELYDPATGIWTMTGNLNTTREYHTATLLPNGQVLVAGGIVGVGGGTNAELYNPATGIWTLTGALNVARYNHTATLLPNGQVLVAGGTNTSSLNSAELYNPATGIWTLTGNMASSRYSHTATLLANGQVLVVGGATAYMSGYLASSELYDPATGTWTSTTGTLMNARYDHTATLLSNGMVLVAGGFNNSGAMASAELYDPVAKTWATTGSLSTGRYWHTANLLPDGQILISGGVSSSSYLTTTELYNPATGVWTASLSMAHPRAEHTATLLSNGQVLVAGGVVSSVSQSTTELYDPAAGTFSTTGSLSVGRFGQTATLLTDGTVLVTGGYTDYITVTSTAEIYYPTTGTWSVTASLNAPRGGQTTTLLANGQVLVVGGYNPNTGFDLASAELYNPATGIWTATGRLNTARAAHTATLLPDGQVLVAGGFSAATGVPIANAELYNPATGTFTTTGSLMTARSGHTATLLPNGQVLAEGGIGIGVTGLASAELYNPSTGTWTTTGSMTAACSSQTASLLPNDQVLVAGGFNAVTGAPTATAELYDVATGTWTTTGNMLVALDGATATLLSSGNVLIAGGNSENTGALTSVEIYNPATGSWTATSSLNTARTGHTATLLPNGQVMVCGGQGSPSLASAELYDPGLGYGASTQPQLSTAFTVNSGAALSLTGTNFTGVSEASGGATNNSASNIPVVQLESLANEQTITVLLDPSQGFNSTSFTSLPPNGLAPGYALLTMFVNGTPTISQIVDYLEAQTISNFPSMQIVTLSESPITLPTTTSAGLTITYTAVSGPATVSGNSLTLTGAGTVVLQANQVGNDIYAPLSVMQTLTVDQTFAQWEAQYPTLTDTAAADTPENDGIPTLFKYLYNVNPTRPMTAADRAALPTVGSDTTTNPGTDYLTLTYRENPLITGITINVQTSLDLQTWTTLKASDVPPDFLSQQMGTDPTTGDPMMEVGVKLTGATKQFIRLNVTSP